MPQDPVDDDVVTVPASSPAQTRAQIIRAAQEVFGKKGFAGGRTLEIAATARVTERTLFRHFPTKAELFATAAVEPLRSYVDVFVDGWKDRPHGVLSAWDETRGFYAGLLDVLEDHRGLVVALIAARQFDDPTGVTFTALDETVRTVLSGAEAILASESAARGFRGTPAVNVRLMLGLAMSVAAHDDWLFAGHARPDREQMLDHITAFTLHGLGADRDT